MAATAACSFQIAAARPCISSSHRVKAGAASLGGNSKSLSWTKLTSACSISSLEPFQSNFTSIPINSNKVVTGATSESSENMPVSGLQIDLKGKRAFIAGVGDDVGYGWTMAKSLAAAGAQILVGTWVPAFNILETSLLRGKFDESRILPDGCLMEITKIYPLDAVFDIPDDVPEDIKTNRRYAAYTNWTTDVSKPMLDTSRKGYLAALSASTYSNVSLLKHSIPLMNPGMSSTKAALESDTRVLAFEAGRKHKIRVNTISAGPLKSRAAKAVGFVDKMLEYSLANAPLQKELSADEVGNTVAFLASPLPSAIIGAVIYVDNGLNAMGVGVDRPIFKDLNIPSDKH